MATLEERENTRQQLQGLARLARPISADSSGAVDLSDYASPDPGNDDGVAKIDRLRSTGRTVNGNLGFSLAASGTFADPNLEGHATVAGACATVLKAFFDESDVIKNPMVSNTTGTALLPYLGSPLTVGGELNKVASNVANARNGAGVHWRTDAVNSLKLGESVAIGILEEQKLTYNDDVKMTLTRFDGTTITI